MGRTPGKASRIGREVFERMKKNNTAREYIDDFGDTVKEFWDDGSKIWRDIKEADMGHIKSAVDWWNDVAIKNGYLPKGKEVREFMLDSSNYVYEYYKTNRSKGAKLLKTYLSP